MLLMFHLFIIISIGTIVRSLVTSSDNDKSLRTVGGNSIANNITAVSLATKEDNTVIIVTGSRDGTSLVWNMETEHEMPYYAIKFEGKKISYN